MQTAKWVAPESPPTQVKYLEIQAMYQISRSETNEIGKEKNLAKTQKLTNTNTENLKKENSILVIKEVTQQ